jgi:peptide/nickel transport system substrate-binding protein
MGRANVGLRSVAVASVAVMVLAACSGGSSSQDSRSKDADGKPSKGGTLTMLMQGQEFDHIDPQRAYNGEDVAFLNGYLTRSLTAYKVSPDAVEAGSLVPDMATDTGTAEHAGKDWHFTLREGMKWQDGTPVTCDDVKYGVSRTFATDVITDGPTYAIQYLDIPKDKDGTSVYKGPYITKGNNLAAYDKAVVCKGAKITFHLSRAIGDFNYTVSIGFGALPQAADKAEEYDRKIVSNGPYKIREYTKGRQMVLVRNHSWSPASDNYRSAYPDKIVVKFGLDPSAIDRRMIRDSVADRHAFGRDPLLATDVAPVFADSRYVSRRVNAVSSFTRFLNINASKVTDRKQRQAIAVAIDRAQIRQAMGGKFAGDLADGVVKPTLAQDYAPSGMWAGLLGQTIADSGDPDYARTLIRESGKPMPPITYSYRQTPEGDKIAAVVLASLEGAGIKAALNPIEPSAYFDVILEKDQATELIDNGWSPDVPNASSVIPALFTPNGGWDLSYVDDKAFNAKVDAARSETDRPRQAQMWKALNREAMRQAWCVPYLVERDQRLAGSRVRSASGKNGRPYILGSFGSWPYHDMYVVD